MRERRENSEGADHRGVMEKQGVRRPSFANDAGGALPNFTASRKFYKEDTSGDTRSIYIRETADDIYNRRGVTDGSISIGLATVLVCGDIA